jgi:hypothetical protein
MKAATFKTDIDKTQQNARIICNLLFLFRPSSDPKVTECRRRMLQYILRCSTELHHILRQIQKLDPADDVDQSIVSDFLETTEIIRDFSQNSDTPVWNLIVGKEQKLFYVFINSASPSPSLSE